MANPRPVLGIIAALPAEARCLGVRHAPVGEAVTVADDVLLMRCGIGRARAAQAAVNLVDAGVGALLSWGTAAALGPDLSHGDLVLAREVVSWDGRRFGADRQWCERLWERIVLEGHCYSGGAAEADGALEEADDKRRLHALSGALIADMESAAIARVADEAGLPVLIIRAVSDSVVTRVPACALAAVDGNGDIDVSRLVARLLCAPAELPSLLVLAKGFRKACARLTRIAELAGPGFLLAPLTQSDQAQA